MESMPRTFRLYQELENSVHGKLSDHTVSYGLTNGDDQTFTNWNGTIFGPANTAYDNRIYSLTIVTDEDYPAKAPKVRFETKINLPFVNQTNGIVEPSKFSLFRNWTPSTTLEGILVGIKKEMQMNAKLPQPAEGATF